MNTGGKGSGEESVGIDDISEEESEEEKCREGLESEPTSTTGRSKGVPRRTSRVGRAWIRADRWRINRMGLSGEMVSKIKGEQKDASFVF